MLDAAFDLSALRVKENANRIARAEDITRPSRQLVAVQPLQPVQPAQPAADPFASHNVAYIDLTQPDVGDLYE